MGVTGIRLRGKDRVVAMDVVEPNGYLLVITDKGQGKRTPLDEYLAKGRGTLGVTTISQEAREEIGDIAEAKVVQDGEDITLITRAGIVLRTKVSDISIQGRATQGVRIMDLDEGDSLAALARISAEEAEATQLNREAALTEEEQSFSQTGKTDLAEGEGEDEETQEPEEAAEESGDDNSEE